MIFQVSHAIIIWQSNCAGIFHPVCVKQLAFLTRSFPTWFELVRVTLATNRMVIPLTCPMNLWISRGDSIMELGRGCSPIPHGEVWGDERMYAVPICNCHDSSWRCCCILNAHHRSLYENHVTGNMEIFDIAIHRAPKCFRPFFGVCFPYIHHFKREVSPSGLVPFPWTIQNCFHEWKNHMIQVITLLKMTGSWSCSWLTSPPAFDVST